MAYIVSTGTILSPEFVGPFKRRLDAYQWAGKHEGSFDIIRLTPDTEYHDYYGILQDDLQDDDSVEDETIVHGTAQYDINNFEPEEEDILLTDVIPNAQFESAPFDFDRTEPLGEDVD